jgi:hypothetical protein
MKTLKPFKNKFLFPSIFRFFLLTSYFLILTSTLTGCIRLAGSAGYYKQGAEDEYPKSKSVGFDTNQLIPGQPPPGADITQGEI